MTQTEADRQPSPAPEAADPHRAGQVRRALAGTRAPIRIAYRDPEHVTERLSLYASERLAQPSRDWAERARRARPDTPPAVLIQELGAQTAKLARIDGAVAGTPFLIALVPGYMGFLWQEARLGLRAAALYGHDPAALDTAADMLVLRGVHPTAAAAVEALERIVAAPAPEKPARRRSLSTWYHSVRLLLVFGGFLSAPDNDAGKLDRRYARLRAAVAFVLATAVWVATWVFPVTFMIAMAWSCESHARRLGARLLAHYDADGATAFAESGGREKRTLLASLGLGLSVAIPIGFVAFADSVNHSTGFSRLTAVGALVALSLVLAATVLVSRRDA